MSANSKPSIAKEYLVSEGKVQLGLSVVWAPITGIRGCSSFLGDREAA